jgi:DNA polymerase-3 subunit gamma/tau
MLSQAAFNAFLKTLEEPPKHAIFILATTEKHKIIPTILSRCQIFDFKRITVTDARKHLVQIAQEEGIEADEEALHIIAQKADGAMRDALSIFDRVVSFSGKTLSRKAVTENLNVLDYDTYFTSTDFILKNDIPQLLLQFNDILSRGFDGHHFIAGLASHFRDLMVCKNPPTIHLLEVGNGTKKKYYEQSQQTEMPFLLKAIEMANSCDLTYKTSRNQRLLVELCLMQLASITYDGEKKNDKPFIIPPSFYTLSPDSAQKVDRTLKATVNIENQSSAIAQNQAQPAQAIPVTAVSNPSVQSQAIAQEQITETSQSTIQQESTQPKAAISKDRVSGLSLKSLQRKKQLEEKLKDQKVDITNLPKEPFTEIAMQAAWQEYVSKISQKGEKIIASNLEADTPKLEGTVIKLEYPNATMKIEVERAQGPLLEFIKRKLNNYDITLDIAVNEEVQRKYAYTGQERYDKLREQNPDLDILKHAFDLQILEQ